MRSSTLVLAFGLVLASALGPVAHGATNSAPASNDQFVRGTVKAIRGDIVVVDMSDAKWLPHVYLGLPNEIHLSFDVPGVGLVKGDGKWIITQVNHDSFEMRALSPGALASVRPGYAVLLPRNGYPKPLQSKEQYAKDGAAARSLSTKRGKNLKMTDIVWGLAYANAYESGDFDEALVLAKKIIALNVSKAESAGMYLDIARILDYRGQTSEAEEDYRKAVALDSRASVAACRFFVEHKALGRGRAICDLCLEVMPGKCDRLSGVAHDKEGNR